MAQADNIVPLPTDHRNLSDPGDTTGRNFRYQYAYGVMLLIAACGKNIDYEAVWCEQHEDFLGEIRSDLFDAYQVKTQQPENGWWQHNSSAYTKSIKRFVLLEKSFPGRIRRFFFVSNTRPLDTADKHKKVQSPVQLITAVMVADDYTSLAEEHKAAFNYLLEQAELTAAERECLFGVLRRLQFPDAPDRDGFLSVLAHEHLPTFDGCNQLNPDQLNRLASALIAKVESASTLGSQDPTRHYVALTPDSKDPQLKHKRIDLHSFKEVCLEALATPVTFGADLTTKPLEADVKKLDVFRAKLGRGGFDDDEMEALRRQTIVAHGSLLELASRGAEGEQIVREIENLVLDECNAAKISASSQNQVYGKKMYTDIRSSLQTIAKDQPYRVKRLPFEVLMGMAGLLTEDCTVWWSEKFDLNKPT